MLQKCNFQKSSFKMRQNIQGNQKFLDHTQCCIERMNVCEKK